ncbi:MAG: phosphoribosylamine--glycine ligase [Chitinophagales bacterium]|nr:MAG: phosphoribosylamine--glycine ligase [Chitinophagales bacterium]
MHILLLGGGGREHAFAWKIAQSRFCKKLFIAPGNGGTLQLGENVTLQVNDFAEVERLVIREKIDMVVVGPEDPLVNGIVDYFQASRGLQHVPVIGPPQAGAQLEGSKAFSKKFMQRHGIPTAPYLEVQQSTLEEGLAFIDQLQLPVVLKADGLAAGKGVLICPSHKDAREQLSLMLNGLFGKASQKVIIEQFLSGKEFSVFILTDGRSYKLLPEAKDYKRVGEGDSGPNTGGMGAVSPVPFVSSAMLNKVEQKIILPTLNGLRKEGISYKGFLYFGLMQVADEPYVIEYNCRMGDPETQVVLPRIESDLIELFRLAVEGNLDQADLKIKPQTCATVVLASKGYPGSYEKGKEIQGASSVKDCMVFHAGTQWVNGRLVTSGGRVMSVSAYGNDFRTAIQNVYSCVGKLSFDGMYYRSDIGFDL